MTDLYSMKPLVCLAALLLCSACGSDAGHSPIAETGDDGTGGEGFGTGGVGSTGTGGIVALRGSGGASGGVATATGGVGAASGGSAGSPALTRCGAAVGGGQCDPGSLCYSNLCVKACVSDTECGTGERCGELYGIGPRRLSETTRPPLGCLKPCHIPGVAPDVSGCDGIVQYCEFFIGSRIVGADDGNWLPTPDICAGGAHFCAAASPAEVTGSHLCEDRKP